MAITRIGGANAITGVIPVANGGTGATSFSPGRVLQVVSTIRATEITTSSQSYVTTNCTASITPSATSSKVLVTIAGAGRQNDDGGTAKYTVFRDSTALGSNTANGFSEISVSGGTFIKGAYVINFLDSPSSLSLIHI